MRCAVYRDSSAHHHHHGNLLDDKVRDDKLWHGNDEHADDHRDRNRSDNRHRSGRGLSERGSGRSSSHERVQRRAELVVCRGLGVFVHGFGHRLAGLR